MAASGYFKHFKGRVNRKQHRTLLLVFFRFSLTEAAQVCLQHQQQRQLLQDAPISPVSDSNFGQYGFPLSLRYANNPTARDSLML